MRPSLLGGLAILALTACTASSTPSPADPSSTAPNDAATPSVSAKPITSRSATSTAPASPGAPSCLGLVQAMPLPAGVGQLYMVGVSAEGLEAGARRAIMEAMWQTTVTKANAEPGSGPLLESATRVLQFKAKLGLVSYQ